MFGHGFNGFTLLFFVGLFAVTFFVKDDDQDRPVVRRHRTTQKYQSSFKFSRPRRGRRTTKLPVKGIIFTVIFVVVIIVFKKRLIG